MADRRLIVLTGTADFNVIIGDIANYESTVRNAFASAGWDIVAVRLSKALGASFTNNVTITIEANVVNEFTAEQARVIATQVLASIQTGYIYSGPLFTTIALRVLSDGENPHSDVDLTVDNTLSNIYRGISDLANSAVTGATTGLGGNIGIPLAIGGIAILLLVMYAPRVPSIRRSR